MLRKQFLRTIGLVACASSVLASTACYRLDITQAPLYDDIMVKQEKKVTDPRRPPTQNPQSMPKAYKKPVFNNELMRPSYMQRTPIPADVRDAQGVLPPERPEPGYPSLYGVPTNPNAGAIQQDATANQQQLQQELNGAQRQQQQMFGDPPAMPSGTVPPPPPAMPAPQGMNQGMPPLAPLPGVGGTPPAGIAPQAPSGAGAAPPPPPPAYMPGPSGFNQHSPLPTEKKTLKVAGHFVVEVTLLEEEGVAPIPLPLPQAASEEPEWHPPIGAMETTDIPSMPRASTPEGIGFAAPAPQMPPDSAPQIRSTVQSGGGAEPLPWVQSPNPTGTPLPYASVFPPPTSEVPQPFVNTIPQDGSTGGPFAPALSRRPPVENLMEQRARERMPPPPATPQDMATYPLTPPLEAADTAIRTRPEGYVARDNNPEPRDHTYDYVGLAGVPLQDVPSTKPYIDGLDEEVFGYVGRPKGPPKPPSTHAWGTPEIPDGAGHSRVTENFADLGYADDPELFNEEPMLLNPFKYDNRPRVNHPDFSPPERPKARPKRHEIGARFNPAYRYEPPEIGGPEHSSYYGYTYFKNVYND